MLLEGSVEMTQWLTALAALTGLLELIPRIQMVAHNCLYSISKKSDALFWPLWVQGVQGMLRTLIQEKY